MKTQLPFDAEIISSPLQSSFTFPFHLPSEPSSEISCRTKKTQLGIGKRTGKCLNYCTTRWIIFMKRISHVAQSLRTRTTGSSEKKSSLRAVEVERNSTLKPVGQLLELPSSELRDTEQHSFPSEKCFRDCTRFLPRNLNICARERHSQGRFTYVRNTLHFVAENGFRVDSMSVTQANTSGQRHDDRRARARGVSNPAETDFPARLQHRCWQSSHGRRRASILN